MADQILDQVRELAEGQIVRRIVHNSFIQAALKWECNANSSSIQDFEGQRLAEFLSTALLSIVGAVAFFVGYIKEDIKLALALGLIGTALTFALVVPPWPFFKRHPVRWLPAAGNHAAVQDIVVDGKTIN
ncbi:hypothetical protein ACMFMG_008383 [Clarireedia jacksonii]